MTPPDHDPARALRDLAAEAQNRLCAADKQHDWSKWRRTALKHDITSLGPIGPDNQAKAMQEAFRVKSERVCLNCGRKQTQ